MVMLVAFNEDQNLVHIQDVIRGLACSCICFECGERVLARKGDINEHHFAHISNKESCVINLESVLHKYAKEVISKEKSITLPAIPEQESEARKWNFEKVVPEFHLGLIRPDLMCYSDGTPIFIEIAVTHFIDEKKINIIKQMDVKTVEIDLSSLIKNTDITIPSNEAKLFILENLENKIWKYPALPVSITGKDLIIDIEKKYEDESKTAIENLHPWEDYKFKINGIWVNTRHFSSGMISLNCVYNPELIAIFKQWMKEGGGKYNEKYKSWNYWKPFSQIVFQRLEKMHSLNM